MYILSQFLMNQWYHQWICSVNVVLYYTIKIIWMENINPVNLTQFDKSSSPESSVIWNNDVWFTNDDLKSAITEETPCLA